MRRMIGSRVLSGIWGVCRLVLIFNWSGAPSRWALRFGFMFLAASEPPHVDVPIAPSLVSVWATLQAKLFDNSASRWTRCFSRGLRDLRRSKAILHILFFVECILETFGSHPTRLTCAVRCWEDLKIKACFIVSGHFLQPSHILDIELADFTLIRSAGAHTPFLIASQVAESRPWCDQPHTRQTLRHPLELLRNPVTEGTSRMTILSLKRHWYQKNGSYEVVSRPNQVMRIGLILPVTYFWNYTWLCHQVSTPKSIVIANLVSSFAFTECLTVRCVSYLYRTA